ncbi:MAG: hypothetical protein ACR2FY_08635 [Pirellulaceae bacterium]
MNWFTGHRESMPDDLERLLYPTRHLAKSLRHHASGLRLSLYGMLLTLCGLVGLLIWFVGPRLNLQPNALTWVIAPAAMLAIIGAFVNMWGKYRCFEFPIELSGRWMLNVAIWCDGIMLTTRFVSRVIPLLKVARLAEPILLLASLVFFLLFFAESCRCDSASRFETLRAPRAGIAWGGNNRSRPVCCRRCRPGPGAGAGGSHSGRVIREPG